MSANYLKDMREEFAMATDSFFCKRIRLEDANIRNVPSSVPFDKIETFDIDDCYLEKNVDFSKFVSLERIWIEERSFCRVKNLPHQVVVFKEIKHFNRFSKPLEREPREE